MPPSHPPLRVAVYGTGKWARRTHLPNLLKLSDVSVVAACDANPEALRSALETFRIPSAYEDKKEQPSAFADAAALGSKGTTLNQIMAKHQLDCQCHFFLNPDYQQLDPPAIYRNLEVGSDPPPKAKYLMKDEKRYFFSHFRCFVKYACEQ